MARRGVGDYFVDSLPERINPAQGVPVPMGPADGPIAGPKPTLVQQLKRDFIVSPRKKVPFLVPSALVAIPNGVTVYTTVCSYTVDQRHTGFLQRVGIRVVPGASAASIAWQLEISGEIHPKFNGLIFLSDTLSTPDDFEFELVAGDTVVLLANNSAGAPITVAGKLQGWTAMITMDEPFGVTREAAG